MFSRDIPLYTLDLTGKNPDNLVTREYYRRTDPSSQKGFVLRHGPFYTESLVLTKPNEELMIEGVHYEIFGIATALTAFVQDKEVAMLIVLKDDTITEWFASYQVVGHFSVLNRDLINMVEGALEDDRPVYWRNIKNKPLWFPPELHQHDIRYEIHSFQDIIELIKRITDVKAILPNRNKVSIDHFNTIILGRITDYERMLLEYIDKHNNDDTPPFTNSHGLTAKQMELEKVDNFKTATLIDVINGYRTDLHVTVDYVKQALDTVSKDTDNLIKVGTLPILRYGSNSFIPTPIRGSFEGAGGNDFYFGCNLETNGDTLILMNRNDGRVDGLYFMENKDKDLDPAKWIFTGYRYTHQTAIADGVNLTKILRGSNGQFLVVGGYNTSGKLIWYYALGGGTFNPDKHTLNRFSDEVNNLISMYSFVNTEAYPNRIYLTIPYDDIATYQNYRDVAYSYPASLASVTDYSAVEGVIFYSDENVQGLRSWEFSVADKQWRKIIFNYKQPSFDNIVQSEFWAPYKIVIEEVTPSNPRADGKNYKYGIKRGEYVFSALISRSPMYLWNDSFLGVYDEQTDNFGVKLGYYSRAYDSRPDIWQFNFSAFGAIYKNRKVVNDLVYYDIENHKSLTTETKCDVSLPGQFVLTGDNHRNVAWGVWIGASTTMWVKKNLAMFISTTTKDSFPARIVLIDYTKSGTPLTLNDFVNNDYLDIPLDSYSYNETNPAGFSISEHSSFWIQLDNNNANSFGSISYTGNGLVFRKHPALDSAGFPTLPSTTYTLYNALTYGYKLENTHYVIDAPPGEIYNTQIYINAANNGKDKYSKNLVGHHCYPTVFDENKTYYVRNSEVKFLFKEKWDIQKKDTGYTFVATKSYDVKDAVTNVLLPKVVSAFPDNPEFDFTCALRSYRIGFANLAGSVHENLLLFSVCMLNTNTDHLHCAVVAFTLTGGTAGSDGVITGATTTVVGNVLQTQIVALGTPGIAATKDPNSQSHYEVNIDHKQARDLIRQLSNQRSFVVLETPVLYRTNNDHWMPGVALTVTDQGVQTIQDLSPYWVAGNVFYVHHPYYGVLKRNRSIGSSEIGYPMASEPVPYVDFDYTKNVLGNSNYLESAFNIYVNSDKNALLNGREYTLKSSIIDLKTIVPNPANRTFYLYLDYGNEGPYYHASTSSLVETPSRALISIIKTNADSIYEIENFNVFTMNGYRISTTRHGSVIPAATGSIEEDGQVNGWVS